MSKLSLGIDTSNYTTSIAVTDREGNIIADERRPLKVKAGEKGLRQSEALYQHWQNLPRLLEEVLRDFGRDIKTVAVSTRPRPKEGSYMPVFNGGLASGQMIAAALGCSLIETSHQEGHIAAAARNSKLDFSRPVICAHLSGGTLELVLKKGDVYEIAGGTKDISYGQLLDRTGVDAGYAFPAGKDIDQLALAFRPEGFKNPLCRVFCDKSYLNLSGLETQLKSAKNAMDKEMLAYCLMDRISESFVKICEAAKEETGAEQVLVTGGVACSEFLRNYCEGRGYHFGERVLCSDNAVGVSLIGGKACL